MEKRNNGRIPYEYKTFAETKLLRSIFSIMTDPLADYVTDGQLTPSLQLHDNTDRIFSPKAVFRDRWLAMETLYHHLFRNQAGRCESVPSRVAVRHLHGKGCGGVLHYNVMGDGCGNKMCPKCFIQKLLKLYASINKAASGDDVLLTTTLINKVCDTKIEQEFTQAAQSSMADPYSNTHQLTKYCGRFPYVTEFFGQPAVGYTLFAVVEPSKVEEYVDAIGRFQRKDIYPTMQFNPGDTTYLERCFKYPLSLFFPKNSGLFSQFMEFSHKTRALI